MTARPARRSAIVLALASTLLACSPAPEMAHGLSERTVARLASAPPMYAPPPGAAAEPETAAMAAAFEGALEPQARARVRHDPALDLAAAALAENFSDQGRRTSNALAQWLLWRSGSVALHLDHSGGYVGGRGRSRGQNGLLGHWVQRAADELNALPGNVLSYGLARFTEGKITSETIVFGQAAFDVSPFSKAHAPGGRLVLELRPRVPTREIRVLLDTGDGVEAETLPARPDGTFVVSRPLPSRPGRYFLEIEGPAPLHPLLLWVPLHVGVPEPAVPDAFLQSPPPGPADPAAWPAWLAAHYDGERARLGKPPVEVDPRLASLAADRSLAAAANRRLLAPDADAFASRLTAAGLAADSFAEAVTNTPGPDAILLQLLRPSVRKRMLLSDRVLYGAAAAPRPVQPNHPPAFSVVEETALPAGAPGK